jgi:hypothetical protein
MSKWVYSFGGGKADGRADMRNLLGGKGANLAEMSSLGLPVPPGITITTEVCTYFYSNGKSYPADLQSQVAAGLAQIESTVGAKFGDAGDPLLVSVRSGARVSMPGMMDTVLNLGLNDKTVEGLATKSGDPRFAYDSYRRFIQMYGDVVLGVEPQFRETWAHRTAASTSTPSSAPTTGGGWSRPTRPRSGMSWARRSRRTRGRSCGAPSAPCSGAGTQPAPSSTGACTASPRTGARRSVSRPWCSATGATTARPASPSPATPRPAPTRSTANT